MRWRNCIRVVIFFSIRKFRSGQTEMKYGQTWYIETPDRNIKFRKSAGSFVVFYYTLYVLNFIWINLQKTTIVVLKFLNCNIPLVTQPDIVASHPKQVGPEGIEGISVLSILVRRFWSGDGPPQGLFRPPPPFQVTGHIWNKKNY